MAVIISGYISRNIVATITTENLESLSWVQRDFMDKSGPVLNLEEKLAMGMALFINLLIAAFFQWSRARNLFLINCIITLGIFSMSIAQSRFQHIWIRHVRDWYVVALLLTIYLENRSLIPLINPHDIDGLLIEMDQVLFLGHNPTILMEKVTWPALTEAFQLIYASFYFLPLSLCLLLYRKKRHEDFHIAASTIIMGFFLSFIGYYLMPAIGPRFTLVDRQAFPLSGLFLFDGLQYIIARTEGVMRDCCPSGHALVSVLTVLIAWRSERRFFPAALVWAALIIFSTVYLRYHYVTDLIVGISLGFAVYRWGEPFARSTVSRNRLT
jgi:membrane-associated phospholipid phosphatase